MQGFRPRAIEAEATTRLDFPSEFVRCFDSRRMCCILAPPKNAGRNMASDLDQVRRSTPDLAQVDPLSIEVRAWLDSAYHAVRRIDRAEAVILRLHEQALSDPARKRVASVEIAKTVDRAATTSAILRRVGAIG